MNETFNTPILFLVFNRPQHTQQVFNQLRNLKPKYLFLAADGPRPGKNEDEKCKAVRDIVTNIDWDCEVKTLFRDGNLGCGPAVSSAITWFFSHVEAGIILEDDCLPSFSFFQFCELILAKYKDDQRIWHIGGYNVQGKIKRGTADYYFSRETPIWGWATWRRVWNHYNLKFDNLQNFENSDIKEFTKTSWLMSVTALYDFKKVDAGKINTWDYQYAYRQLINHGLSVIPNKNLVENIGFIGDTTHEFRGSLAKKFGANKALDYDYSNMVHPQFFVPEVKADKLTYRIYTRLVKKVFVIVWFYMKYKIGGKKNLS